MKQKYRISQFLDTSDDTAESYPILYGVQVYHNGKWHNCCEGSTPLLYSEVEQAAAKIAELKGSAS